MTIPDFILQLRAKIGNDPLWLPGVTAVVTRERDGRRQILLVRRADDGRWTPVTGIIDPGEQPAVAAEREVSEEAGVQAVATRLAAVDVLPPTTYDNGDRSQYLDLVFACDHVTGEPWPADGENTEAVFFDLDELPSMDAGTIRRVELALSPVERAVFVR